MKFRALLILNLLFLQLTFAARPTVNPSNLYISVTNCTSVTLTWSNGNGNARMVIGREGSSSSFTPIDGTVYSGANAAFGYGSALDANGNYVLMNGVGSSNLAITNLKAGTTYTFLIFEHDNNGSSTEYLTSNAPTINVTTYNTSLNFTLVHLDSCERTNMVRLTNTSSSTIPGQTYTYDVNSTSYNADVPVDIHLKNTGMVSIKINAPNSKGCPSTFTKNAKIFPRRLANFDFKNSPDTIQDYIGHLFKMQTVGITMPFPLGVTYNWDLGDGTTSQFVKIQKKYVNSDTYLIRLILNATTYGTATACKDTLYTHFILRPNPYLDLTWGRDTIYEDYDDYVASVNSDKAITLKWYFGDGDSSSNDTTSHIYTTPGKYTVRLHIKTNFGYEGDTSKNVVVLPLQDIFGNLKWLNGPFYHKTNSNVAYYLNTRIESFTWYFGDGDSSNDINIASHIYQNPGTYIVKIKVRTLKGIVLDSSHSITILKNPVSIDQQTFNAIKIGPNPSNNQISVSNPNKANLDIVIYNFNGQMIYNGSIHESIQSIDVSNFESGVYSVVILENGSVLGSQNITIMK